MATPDFTIFRTNAGGVGVYTSFDKEFVAAAKRIGARFQEFKSGRVGWILPASAADKFDDLRVLADAAKRRLEDKAIMTGVKADLAFEAMTQAQKAGWYNRTHNEGREGYNPYR